MGAAYDALLSKADAAYARTSARFFKTGAGQYGEGDRFIGVRVPDLRRLARAHEDAGEAETLKLLASPLHEARLLALLIWTRRFERGAAKDRRRVFELYWMHRSRVNNWDLVDLSAPLIVGAHLFPDRTLRRLEPLTRSASLWDRRIAVVAAHYGTRRGVFQPVLRLSWRLLGDSEDLIHKAVGWMLREAGKRNPPLLRYFLRLHAPVMPRTCLRYALECFPGDEREDWLRRSTVGVKRRATVGITRPATVGVTRPATVKKRRQT